MRVSMISCDHENLEVLEIFKRHFLFSIDQLHDPSHVLISTCNRIEYYFTQHEILNQIHQFLSRIPSDDLIKIEPHLHFKNGESCFIHLCRVAAGLDSLILCETEILGQIKNSYERATKTMELHGELHFIFQKAIAIGKQVRTAFHFFKGLPDIEHSIVDIAKEKYKETKIEDIRVLMLGASAINKKIVNHLKQHKGIKSITVCSYSREHAEQFAKENNTDIVAWELRHDWGKYHVIISAARLERDYLFSKDTFKFLWDDEKIVFDLGVPRNIDPLLDEHPKLQLVNLQELDDHVNSQRFIAEKNLIEVEKTVKEKTAYHIQNYYKRQEYAKNAVEKILEKEKIS